MSEVLELGSQLGEYAEKRYNKTHFISQMLKVLIVTSSILAGVAHFLIEKELPDGWHFVGIMASIIVGLAGIVLIGLESSPAGEIEVARKALAEAQRLKAECNEIALLGEGRESVQLRTAELYSALTTMCSVIQATMLSGTEDETKVIDTLLTANERSLKIAAGFTLERHWTLCVYRAERDLETNRTMLRCVASIRSVPCDVRLARRWPEGVGVGGSAYATGEEVVTPDLWAQGVQAPTSDLIRPDDRSRYGSMAAVPIKVRANHRPWGVVVATNSEKGFFSNMPGPGAKTITLEVPRSVAGLVSLAVEICSLQSMITR